MVSVRSLSAYVNIFIGLRPNLRRNLCNFKKEVPLTVTQTLKMCSSSGSSCVGLVGSYEESQLQEIGVTSIESNSAAREDVAPLKNVEPISKKARKRQLRRQRMEEAKKRKIEKKEKKCVFDDEKFSETSYYTENGLRKVYPYNFTFSTYAKGRWVGKKLYDVMTKEFRSYTPERYERNINNGAILINGEPTTLDHLLTDKDLISNTVHRHELAVTMDPIDILHLSDDLLVIDKPSSIPVHPCGRYRHNSIIFILGKQYGLKELRTIHRLDRLTSGVLIFAREWQRANQMTKELVNRDVEKTYVCRVAGKFPDGIITVDQPLDCISQKIGIFWVQPTGKTAQTDFERLSYNGKTSVVRCSPRTGRTHQIRVHLQFLGHAIINDPIYNSDVWGPNAGLGGKYDKTKDEIIRDMLIAHDRDAFADDLDPDNEVATLGGEVTTLDGEVATPGLEVLANAAASVGDSAHHSAIQKPTTPPPSPTAAGAYPTRRAPPPSPPAAAGASPTRRAPSGGTSRCDWRQTLDRYIAAAASAPIRTMLEGAATRTPAAFNAAGAPADDGCDECRRSYRDPVPSELVMYLHALSYKGKDWSYSTKMPEWASEEWIATDPSDAS
ncbi:PREDICTED: RNA pseudouridylate synthase domain-containing protein 2-like [Priapulus caudatus]|uniref:RNA pseudouridylate synthase domain-containing protein 2-like n=1 Tax=Priapulus caudatus TaxID=37621 RepID=A0ABM1EY03_PRICU|nr:PREDICTED: RNA pseudouridylate synthase domain-containing protein 2-like [Priapulus caudatus]